MKSTLEKHVTTLALAGAISFAAALSARAQIIAYDGFNYPNTTPIGITQVTTPGDSFGWGYAWPNSTATSKIGTNVASGLSYGSLPGDGGSLQVGTPQAASGPGSSGGTTAGPQRTLAFGSFTTNTLGVIAAANGGTLWLSFLFYNPTYTTTLFYRQSNLGFFRGGLTNATASGTEIADLGLANGTATQTSQNWAAWGGTVSQGTPNLSTVSAFSASVQFVLVKLVVDTTTAADSYYAWINPSSSLFGNNANAPSTATADVSNTTADLSQVNTFRFQAGNANANGTNAFFTVDEFRLGATFADVTPVPEPAIFGLAAVGGFALLALRRRRQ